MPIGLKGNTDGSGAIQIGGSDAISISTGLNTTFAGTITATGTVAGTTGTLYPLVSGTAVASTSGTSIDFTGIPSWVRRITVMLNGVSTNGSNVLLVQIGSGSVSTSGYASTAVVAISGSASSGATNTSGFNAAGGGPTTLRAGIMTIATLGSNSWVSSHCIGYTDAAAVSSGGGSIALGGALDRVRITTVGGTDTFDAGSINILYE